MTFTMAGWKGLGGSIDPTWVTPVAAGNPLCPLCSACFL